MTHKRTHSKGVRGGKVLDELNEKVNGLKRKLTKPKRKKNRGKIDSIEGIKGGRGEGIIATQSRKFSKLKQTNEQRKKHIPQ